VKEKPACLVTTTVTDYRSEPFRMLAEAENLEVLAHDEGGQAGAVRRIASGRYRAVVCGLGGRLALPGAYLAARRSGVPFVLWASLWEHPRTPVHALSWLPTRHLYRHADAVVTYGPHVSRYVEAVRGSRGRVFVAPQAVDGEHFGADVEPADRGGASFVALFVGRREREKGLDVLLEAWREADLGPDARLWVAGEGGIAPSGPGVRALGQVPRDRLPAVYAAADVLVLPSVRTATFREPWGLVCNEAMHQGRPIIASDAVGAVAGGLVADGTNGLVVPAGDPAPLAARLRALAADPALRERLGAAAKRDVQVYSYAAWVRGIRRALAAVGASTDRHAPLPTSGDLPNATPS